MKNIMQKLGIITLVGVLLFCIYMGIIDHSSEPQSEQTEVSTPQFNKIAEFEHFRSKDGAVIPVKFRIIYDSLNPVQSSRLKNEIQIALMEECTNWTILDILKKDSQFGPNITMLIEDGKRLWELHQLEILQLYSDRDKYIDENYTPASAKRIKQALADIESGAYLDSLMQSNITAYNEAQRIVTEYKKSMLQFEASPEYQEALKKWNKNNPKKQPIITKEDLELLKTQAMIKSTQKEIDKLHKQIGSVH